MKILSRYLLKEYLWPFIFGLFVFTFLLFLGEIFQSSELIITKKVELPLVLNLFLSFISPTLTITIPLAALMATLLTWGRLSADNEIIAMSASGISLFHFYNLMLFLGLCLSLSTLIINEHLVPNSNYHLQQLKAQILQSQSAFCLQEKTFLKLGGMMVYINKIDKKTNRLEGVYIYERSGELAGQREAIFARFGELEKREDYLILRLIQGAVHEVDDKEPSKYHLLNFNLHTMTIDLKGAISESTSDKRIESMNSSEIAEEIEKCKRLSLDHIPLLIEQYKRISLPFACLIFVLIGVPIALLSGHKEKSLGFGLCLFLAFIYYLLFIVGQGLAERLILLPSWAMWLPNGILGGVGLFLLLLAKRR